MDKPRCNKEVSCQVRNQIRTTAQFVVELLLGDIRSTTCCPPGCVPFDDCHSLAVPRFVLCAESESTEGYDSNCKHVHLEHGTRHRLATNPHRSDPPLQNCITTLKLGYCAECEGADARMLQMKPWYLTKRLPRMRLTIWCRI